MVAQEVLVVVTDEAAVAAEVEAEALVGVLNSSSLQKNWMHSWMLIMPG